jgi:membrane associated rhomboid family serine protease
MDPWGPCQNDLTMSSGADLFVVCKQCGSEVSPYVTECPYCGNRLRRRAPKLPPRQPAGPDFPPPGSRRRRPWPIFARPKPLKGVRLAPAKRSRSQEGHWAQATPYATIALVAASCAVWVAWRGGFVDLGELALIGPLRGSWWKLITTQFAYGNGLYEFATLVAIALFGWLMERRRGPVVVLALFLATGVTGALVACAVYPEPVAIGGNAAAIGLLAAWAAPDIEAVRANYHREGDLLGVLAILAVLLAMPFACAEASWLAGVVGGAVGLALGRGLHLIDPPEL